MLSLNNLPLKNLKSSPGRTAAILVFTILMSIATFGGTLIVRSVKEGLAAVQMRLGADILVTPEDAENDFDAQTFLIRADPGYFYMDIGKMDEILSIEGIEKASPQMFLASATAGCCSAKLQIIAFDPETDFTVQPWIRDTFGGVRKMGLMDVIVGSNVTVYEDRILKLYDNECHVIGQFAPTGSSLDNAVYTDFETIRVLIRSSFDKNLNKYQPFNTGEVISSVMIKVKPGYDIAGVAEEIQTRVEGVSTATASNMVSGIVESLGNISGSVRIFIIVFWVIGLTMTILLFLMMIHERSREFASLRAMGAGPKILSKIVAGEAIAENLLGSLIGTALSAVVIIGFSSLIGQKIGAGFVIPPPGQILLLALLSICAVMTAAILSAVIAIRWVSRLDAALILKEGE